MLRLLFINNNCQHCQYDSEVHGATHLPFDTHCVILTIKERFLALSVLPHRTTVLCLNLSTITASFQKMNETNLLAALL